MISYSMLKNNKIAYNLFLIVCILMLVDVVFIIYSYTTASLQAYALINAGYDPEATTWSNACAFEGIGLAQSMLVLTAVSTIIIRCFRSKLSLITIIIMEVLLYVTLVVILQFSIPLFELMLYYDHLWFVLSVFNLALGVFIGNIVPIKTLTKNIISMVLVFVVGLLFAWLPVIAALYSIKVS